jgi:hypothetical protein
MNSEPRPYLKVTRCASTQLVGGVPGEHVGKARLDAHPDQRQLPRPLPVGRHRELLVAELEAGLAVRLAGMRVGQRHRHVQVVGARLERGTE